MKINQVEELVGITKKNIRFYEEQGLLNPERNPQNGYREYSLKDVADLNRVKLFRQLSVPVEEIKQMNEGTLSLSDCLDRHLDRLSNDIHSLELAKELCEKISLDKTSIEKINVESYLEEIAGLERGDTLFMDIEKKDVTKKKIGPIVAALMIFVLAVGLCLFIFWRSTYEEIPLGALLWITIPLAAVAVGIIVALFLRLKEIEGGEEDEASKY